LSYKFSIFKNNIIGSVSTRTPSPPVGGCLLRSVTCGQRQTRVSHLATVADPWKHFKCITEYPSLSWEIWRTISIALPSVDFHLQVAVKIIKWNGPGTKCSQTIAPISSNQSLWLD